MNSYIGRTKKYRDKLGKIGKLAAIGLAVLCSISVAEAQSYNKSPMPQGMTTVVGDPTATVEFDGALAVGSSMDDASVGITLPFAFDFFGVSYTNATISTNGFLTFETFSGTGAANASLANTSSPNTYIAPFWDDLIIMEASNSKIVSKVEGSAPNRVFILEFNGMSRFGQSAAGEQLTGQIRLFEGNNNIEFHYPASQSWTGVSATIGLENETGDFGIGGPNSASSNNAPPTQNFKFEPLSAGTDLVVASVSASTPAAAPGGTFLVTRTIANNGPSDAGAFTVKVYLSIDNVIDPNDTEINASAVASVTGLASDGPSDIAVTIPAATTVGNYFIGIIVDTDNTVTEINETNNSSSAVPFLVGQRPDPAADSITVQATQPAVTSTRGGDSLTFVRTISNPSSSNAPAFRVEVFLSTNTYISRFDTLIEDFTFTNGLAAGATDNATITITVPTTIAAGDYYLGFIIDEDNLVDESDENNNNTVTVTPVTITQPIIDLSADSIDASAVSFIAAGSNMTFTRSITNTGSDPSGSFTIRTYLSTNTIISSFDTLVDDFTFSGGLAAGASDTSTVTIALPPSVLNGTYYVGFVIDEADSIPETDEFNNTAASSNTVTVYTPSQGIDLTVDLVKLSTYAAVPGNAVSISRIFRNGGTDNAGAMRVGIYISDDNVIDTTDRLIKKINLNSMNSGVVDGPSGTIVTIPPNLAPGDYWIGIIADDELKVTESDELNNMAMDQKALTVGGLAGDINGDGDINVMDIQSCANQAAGRLPSTPAADVNKDGQVDVVDVQMIVNTALTTSP
jgi:subtilase family serine protease